MEFLKERLPLIGVGVAALGAFAIAGYLILSSRKAKPDEGCVCCETPGPVPAQSAVPAF